jgi:hypothetical protein
MCRRRVDGCRVKVIDTRNAQHLVKVRAFDDVRGKLVSRLIALGEDLPRQTFAAAEFALQLYGRFKHRTHGRPIPTRHSSAGRHSRGELILQGARFQARQLIAHNSYAPVKVYGVGARRAHLPRRLSALFHDASHRQPEVSAVQILFAEQALQLGVQFAELRFGCPLAVARRRPFGAQPFQACASNGQSFACGQFHYCCLLLHCASPMMICRLLHILPNAIQVRTICR